MKKIIAIVFSFVLLVAGQNVFAASRTLDIWNTAPNDCPDINIANYTTGTGFGSPCWTGTNINASPGDTLNVRVYYHNTSTSTATNTYIKIIEPTGSGTNHSFTAQILSPQGNLYSDNVTVSLPSSQSLTFGSTRWYPNQTQNPANFLNGQNGSEVIGSQGLYIGNIAPGWATQGSVVVSFHVTNNQPEVCNITSFTATPSTITSGGSSLLEWETSNCSSVSMSPYIGGNLPLNGSRSVNPTVTTTYTLTGYNQNGTVGDTDTETVTVRNPIMSGTLTANPNYCKIASGQSTCSIPFTWSTTNPIATSAVTHDGTTVATGNNGSQNFTVAYGDQTYYLYNSGQQLDTETVTASCFPGTTWNGSICAGITVMNCTIESFSSNTYSINQNGSATLSWRTNNCTSATLSDPYTGSSSVAVTGSKIVSPDITTTYTLRARGANSSVDVETLTINVQTVTPGMNGNLSASPDHCKIASGHSTCSIPFTWTTNRPIAVSAVTHNGTTVATGNNGSQNFNIAYGDQTYYLYNSGQLLDTETVNASCFPGANWNGSTCENIIAGTCSINSFVATPGNINLGDSSVLSWSTNNCTSATMTESTRTEPVNVSGSKVVYPIVTTVYTLTARGANGISVSDQETVYVNGNNNNTCRIIDFSASDTSIDEGDSTILSWETDGCERVRITDLGNVSNDGDERVYPDNDTTYTLTAYDYDGGTITDTVRINVDEDNNNNDDDCRIDSYTASSTYINRGDDVTLRWRTTDCDDVSISNFGDVDEDGSEEFSPNNTTTYTLRARGDNGSDSESIQITVGGNDNVYNTNVVTTIATNITQTSAQLNGLITSTNYGNATTYFEYGTNVNLGMRTASRSSGGNSYFNEYVSNLSPNTIYYFRAVGEGTNGISRGAIEVFRTPGYVNTNTNTRIIRETVVEQGNTVYGSLSPIMLRIENRYQTIGVGDVIDYTVYYKNISISRLTNPMVQVFVPKGIIITNSSRGTFSNESRTLSVPIADLNPNDEGVIYLQAVVEELDANLAQIVTTAVLIYTNPNGAQENAMAYALNNPKVLNGNVLGASAFFGNLLGLSLIGWLLLIILIMLLILLSRSYYGRRNTITTTTERTTHQ